MSLRIGIDLGGTNIVAGLVDEEYRILARERMKTRPPRPIEELCADMATLCRGVTAGCGAALSDVEWIGVGTPGIVEGNVVCYANNLSFLDAPLGRLLEEGTGRPVYVQNDGSAAAVGEYVAVSEAGQSCRSLFIMTIGTGIGSGMVLNGRIWNGFNGAAPELGHILLAPGGRPCTCGKAGCFETYASATGLVLSTREAMNSHPESAMWELSVLDGDVSAKTAFCAARAGDETAAAVVEEYLEALSQGVSNVVNLLQPEIFCVGGGVSAEGEVLLQPLAQRVKNLTFAGCNGTRTRIVGARLGNDAGIVGAAMLGSFQH